MSKKKFFLHSTISVLIGMFIVVPFLEWGLGVPSFEIVLVYLFGEPDGVNRLVAVLFSLLIIFLITWGSYKKYVKSS